MTSINSKKTLNQRVSDIEQKEIVLNVEERLKNLERIVKLVNDGALGFWPSKRCQMLEEYLGIDYELGKTKKGKYKKIDEKSTKK